MVDYVQVVLALLLIASVGANLIQQHKASRLHARNESLVADLGVASEELKALKAVEQKRFYDAEALGQDMARYGAGLIKVQRIDPEDVIIRSPRDRR